MVLSPTLQALPQGETGLGVKLPAGLMPPPLGGASIPVQTMIGLDPLMQSWWSGFLYQMYELNYLAARPINLAAEAVQRAFTNPFSAASYTEFGRTVAAGAEMLHRSTRRFGKPAFGLASTKIGGETVAITERIVAEAPFGKLIRFERAPTQEGERDDPKLLLVAPLSGHHATLLRGTVEALLPHHDVYVTDWIDARLVPQIAGAFDLETYIEYVMTYIRVLGPDTHVMAVCQPAVPVLAAVALMAAQNDPFQPRSMTLMGGPIDSRAAPTAVTRLAAERPLSWFEQTVIASVPFTYPGAFRRVYPGFIQLTGFMTMNLDRHIASHIHLFEHLVQGDGEHAHATKRFYDEYMAVMDLPAEFYLQTVDQVFQRHLLPKGEMTWRGAKVELPAIARTALLTVEGELDDISAPGQTEAAQALLTGLPAEKKRSHLQKGVGHYGIFNGRRWREQVMPAVRSHIRDNDFPRSPVV